MRPAVISSRHLPAVAALVALAACGGGGSSSGNSAALLPPQTLTPMSASIPKGYVLTDLGSGLPGSPALVPNAINDQGAVVGEASIGPLGSLPGCGPPTATPACGTPEGWVFKNGTLTELPLYLNTDIATFADDINSSGVISGGSGTPATEEAVLWNPDGSITNLGTGIFGAVSEAEATVISDSGKIDGLSFNSNTFSEVPTAFPLHGEASPLCGAQTQGLPIGINNAGLTIGDNFLAQGGIAAMECAPFNDVETPPAAYIASWWNFGFGINDKGQAVGRLTIGPAFGNIHPFLDDRGTTTDLGTLNPANPASVGAAFGINQSGVIVGWASDGGGVPGAPPVNISAFVYSHGKMVDLNTFLPNSLRSTWRLVVASAINNKGQIAGSAFVGGYPTGVEHAFLLTPVGQGSASAQRVGVAVQSTNAYRQRETRVPISKFRLHSLLDEKR